MIRPAALAAAFVMPAIVLALMIGRFVNVPFLDEWSWTALSVALHRSIGDRHPRLSHNPWSEERGQAKLHGFAAATSPSSSCPQRRLRLPPSASPAPSSNQDAPPRRRASWRSASR